MSAHPFYGPEQAYIHHSAFGDLAEAAAGRVLGELHDAGHHGGTVVDLGCGSGILARRLTDAGYAVHGIDLSADMIELARRTAPGATFERASLLDAELPPAVAVTAIGEALNYATDVRAGPDALGEIFRRVRTSLEGGGVFLLDVATPGRHGPDRVANRIHDRETWTLFMRAVESDDATRLDRYITIFRRTETGAYERIDEHHVLCLYDPGTVVATLKQDGFDVQVLDRYAAVTASTPPTGWVVILARAV